MAFEKHFDHLIFHWLILRRVTSYSTFNWYFWFFKWTCHLPSMKSDQNAFFCEKYNIYVTNAKLSKSILTLFTGVQPAFQLKRGLRSSMESLHNGKKSVFESFRNKFTPEWNIGLNLFWSRLSLKSFFSCFSFFWGPSEQGANIIDQRKSQKPNYSVSKSLREPRWLMMDINNVFLQYYSHQYWMGSINY